MNIRQELSVLLSPVFFKELIQLACSRRTFALRCAFLCTLCGVTYYCVPVEQLDAAGLTLFKGILAVEIAAIFVFAPMLTAGSVAGEREARTLPLLLTTKLNCWNVVQDKGLSRIAYLLFICEFTLPFMFLAVMLGGVTPTQVLGGLLRILNVALVCGGFGIFFSVWRKRFITAMSSTYVYLFMMFYIISVFWFFGKQGGYFTSTDTLRAPVAWFNGVLLNVVTLSNPKGQLIYSLFAVLAYLLGVGIATARMDNDREKGDLDDDNRDEAGTVAQQQIRLRPIRFVSGVTRSSSRFSRAFEKNPDGGALIGCMAIPLASILVLQILANADFRTFAITLCLPLILAVTLLKAACSFTNERSQRRMELLLTCNIRGSTLVRNAYLSIVGSLIPVWLIGLFLYAAVCLPVLDKIPVVFIFGPSALFLAVCSFLATLSMVVSIRSETNTRAIAIAAVVFFLVTGTPMLIRLGVGSWLSPSAYRQLLCIDPFVWFRWSVSPPSDCSKPYLIGQLLFYTISCFALLGISAFRFNSWVKRQAD